MEIHEIRLNQAEDEVVGHALQVPLQQDGGNHEHVAWDRCYDFKNIFGKKIGYKSYTYCTRAHTHPHTHICIYVNLYLYT
jgi:hypothetical protein